LQIHEGKREGGLVFQRKVRGHPPSEGKCGLGGGEGSKKKGKDGDKDPFFGKKNDKYNRKPMEERKTIGRGRKKRKKRGEKGHWGREGGFKNKKKMESLKITKKPKRIGNTAWRKGRGGRTKVGGRKKTEKRKGESISDREMK